MKKQLQTDKASPSWDEVFEAIWGKSQSSHGWVLIGDDVMPALVELGIVTKPPKSKRLSTAQKIDRLKSQIAKLEKA